VSPFYYFHGGEILSGTAPIARNLTALASAAVAACGVAYWKFDRRDL
jgi:hypothetical protein